VIPRSSSPKLIPEAELAAALQLIAAVNRIARGPHAQ
jgi:hypothetical protein